jgi:RHS repeat-associated protein
VTPPGTPGVVDVVVMTPAATATLKQAYTYGPTLVSIAISPSALVLQLGQAMALRAIGAYSDSSTKDLTLTALWTSGNPAVAPITGAGTVRAVSVGKATVTASQDGRIGSALVTVNNPEVLPPDPTISAPPIDLGTPTNIGDVTKFLYSGSNPVQTGVVPGTIDDRRVAVLRGRVLDRGGLPLAGVNVSVLGHPEFGRTQTRSSGIFDFALNGGGPITLVYDKGGYLTLQRQVDVPWRDYRVVSDAVLMGLDPNVVTVDLTQSTSLQVARGSGVVDSDGGRQATILFNPNTQAVMRLADGTTQPLSSAAVRATEYTVGTNGAKSMPGSLPPQSGYTYCVELSVDEAIAAGATSVDFSQPVAFYVENFLNFRVGLAVPAGYYDRSRGAWVPSDDGRVIRILTVTDGLAAVDTNGDGVADDATTLAALGITDAERQKLGGMYAAGQSLWRVRLTHFSPWDFNWPYGPPSNAVPPLNIPAPESDPNEKDPCDRPGSIIECQGQVLGESIPISGTPFTLNYRSDRTAGRKAAYALKIQMSADSIPAGVKRMDLTVDIAGRRFLKSFTPAPKVIDQFVWDGLDAYGRLVQGRQPVFVRRSFVYDAVYQEPAQLRQTFAEFSGIPMSTNKTRQEVNLSNEWTGSLGAVNTQYTGFAGWSISPNHLYDTSARELIGGDGRRTGDSDGVLHASIKLIAGKCCDATPDGGPALTARLNQPFRPAVGPDGKLYFPEATGHVVRRIDRDGTIHNVAGSGVAGFSGDGGTATSAQLFGPRSVAMAPDGSLYIADSLNCRIRKVSQGIITTVAGSGNCSIGGDGLLATQAAIGVVNDMAIGPDGDLYIVTFRTVRKIDRNGIITTVVGTSTGSGFNGDNIPALTANIGPTSIAFAKDGTMYLTDASYQRIRKVTPAGIISTVAGNGQQMSYSVFPVPDGIPALQAALDQPQDIAVAPDGSIYFMDHFSFNPFSGVGDADHVACRRITSDGLITTAAGGSPTCAGECSPGSANFRNAFGIAIAPDGQIYISNSKDNEIWTMQAITPGFNGGEIFVPTADGSAVHVFDRNGRHLGTRESLLGTNQYLFGYGNGGLMSTTDANGNVTQIERDAKGQPTAIVAPGGQRTTLSVGSDGYLSTISNPANESVQFAYTSDGLLTAMTDPRGNQWRFTYDDTGRLIKDEDAAGGSTSLARVATPTGFKVTVTDDLGRATTYDVATLATGERQLTVTDPAGLQMTRLDQKDGSRTITDPDGTKTTIKNTADSRYGLQAPGTTTTIRTPGGKSLQTFQSTSVSAGDFFSVTSGTSFFSVGASSYQRSYDGATRTLVGRSPLGRTITRVLDSAGRTVLLQRPSFADAILSWDSRGLLSSLRQSTRVHSFTYDDARRPVSVTDPAGRTMSFDYDAAGRLLHQVLPDGRVISLSYDSNGNVTSVTPPGRPAHSFTFTPVNLQSSYTPPAPPMTVTSYRYNTQRQLTEALRPDGTTIGLRYDTGGRLTEISTPEGTYKYTYGSGTNLASASSPDGNGIAYTFDGSLLTGMTWTGVVTGSLVRTYDNLFRVASDTLNGSSVPYSYDSDNLLTRAGALALRYDPSNGLLTGTQLGSVTDTVAYNPFGEMVAYDVAYTGALLFSQQLTRDNVGRITQLTETAAGTASVFTYSYDAAGRLTTAARNGVTTSYTYDPSGSRLSTVSGGTSTNATYDIQDRSLTYGGSTFTYTANGELRTKTTASGTTTYTYDGAGNLRHVVLPGGKTIDYVVDAQNRRIAKKVNGLISQQWLYSDQLHIVGELDASATLTTQFVYGSRDNVPDYMIRGGITYRMISNQLGSPRLIVSIADGFVAERLEYDEFGIILTDSNPGFQPFAFAGGLYDRDTGFVHFGARDYDPQTGRWTAKDPIVFQEGDTNLYGYAFNDPVNFLDPTGLLTVPLVGQVPAGEQAGTRAVESYAETLTDPEAEWYEKTGAAVGGGFAALWTPETSDATATVLGCAIGEAAIARGVARGGWLNSNRYLRIGFGKGKGARRVFRIGGDVIKKIIEDGHIDLWKGPRF